ncbi:MAG: polysaccharide pyruvyl transferase family protein [Eubacterium sp.]|nr:polysaccharide pyruvyl transferase family protein [Eubacterium sp.]
MKIAIITWFSNLNFGTALQAFALQNYLKTQYCVDVRLIKYFPEPSNQIHSLAQKTEHIGYKIYSKIKSFIYDTNKRYDELLDTIYKNERDKRCSNFNRFMQNNIVFTDTVKSDEDFKSLLDEFDFFICGSDQIWNPMILDAHYFLHFVSNKPKISYATSFGIDYIPNFSKKRIQEYLSDFKAVSLRESHCIGELECVTSKDVSHVCDPTFLISPEQWKSMESNRLTDKKYFAVYFLGDTRFSRKSLDLAQEHFDFDSVILPCTEYAINRSDKKNITFSPEDFISIIDNSQFVLTDSFHAVCFSIMLEKNFCVIKKHSQSNPFKQNSRIESLLELLGISERLVDNENKLKELIDKDIDYKSVKQRLDAHINSSKAFLEECINGC